MKSKVLSARVPVDVHEMFTKMCKQEGVTTSTYIQNIVTNPPPMSTSLAKGGQVEVPEIMNTALAGLGGAGVGKLVYNILLNGLPDDRLDLEQRQLIALLGGISAGLGTALGLEQMLKGYSK